MIYVIVFKPSAEKELHSLPSDIGSKILNDITKLQVNPRPPGCKKIIGREASWRLRVGAYRILFEVDDRKQIVRILRIRHCKEAYR